MCPACPRQRFPGRSWWENEEKPRDKVREGWDPLGVSMARRLRGLRSLGAPCNFSLQPHSLQENRRTHTSHIGALRDGLERTQGKVRCPV